MTRRSNSATSIPRKTLARSPSRLARKLWTPSILRSVRRESTHIVRKHMREVIIALVLLIITLRLLLLLIIPDIMRVMGIIIIRYKLKIGINFDSNINTLFVSVMVYKKDKILG